MLGDLHLQWPTRSVEPEYQSGLYIESCFIYVLICWQVFLECHLQYHEQEDLQLLPIPLVSTNLIFLYITVSLVYLSFVFQDGVYGNMTLDLMY